MLIKITNICNEINLLNTQETEKRIVFVKQKCSESGPQSAKYLLKSCKKKQQKNHIQNKISGFEYYEIQARGSVRGI